MMMASKRLSFSALPTDVTLSSLAFLSPHNLTVARAAGRHLCALASANCLWSILCARGDGRASSSGRSRRRTWCLRVRSPAVLLAVVRRAALRGAVAHGEALWAALLQALLLLALMTMTVLLPLAVVVLAVPLVLSLLVVVLPVLPLLLVALLAAVRSTPMPMKPIPTLPPRHISSMVLLPVPNKLLMLPVPHLNLLRRLLPRPSSSAASSPGSGTPSAASSPPRSWCR